MKNNKTIALIIALVVILFLGYLIYQALPVLISFSSNVLYLIFSLIVFAFIIYLFYRGIRYFLK